MADPTFDAGGFQRRLTTRRLGRALIARTRAGSTNDAAWEALHQGAADGTAVVADVQDAGRGRSGRTWHTTPGKALALSVLLHPACAAPVLATVPLVAGLALARALDLLGLPTRLKWPNDLLVGDRKLSGILVESRRGPAGSWGLVVGVGVNVEQARAEFPPELRERATSVAIEGCAAGREAIAAEFLNAFEPLWDGLREGDGAAALRGWRERADVWDRVVTVRAPGGTVTGIARDLDRLGGLTLEVEGRGRVTIYAGDLESAGAGGGARSPEAGGR